MLNNFPKSVRIKKIVRESPLVRSYFFDYPERAKPGQFINLWIPGICEKPMSISFDDGKTYKISVAAIGNATKMLAGKKAGDVIGVRGPHGTCFSWKPGERIAMLAGGYGAGPLYFAAYLATREGCKVDFFLGARSEEHLLFTKLIKALKNTRYLPSTDDGSAGFKGFNVQLWEREMVGGPRGKSIKYDRVMTCGPELMMKAVSDIAWAKKIPAQISVERYMKCGFGICGNCCVDDLGITTCQKGTIMDNKMVRQIKEFGTYHRDGVGRKHNF